MGGGSADTPVKSGGLGKKIPRGQEAAFTQVPVVLSFIGAKRATTCCYQSMNMPRKHFVILFVISASAFQFVSNSLLGSEVRLFPASNSESFLMPDSPVAWKRAVSTILLPVKVVLLGPLLPFLDVLRQDPDPPPPFLAIAFAVYWSILASLVHRLLGKLRCSWRREV